MPEWKEGPPTEPGRYHCECKSQHGHVYQSAYQIYQVGGTPLPEDAEILYHYGPIPDPPKPLPSVTKAFLARRTDGEKHDKAIGFYVASESTFYVTDNDGYQAGCTPKRFYDHYEITEWLDGGDE